MLPSSARLHKNLRLSLDPSRSHWQRWNTPDNLEMDQRELERFEKEGKTLCSRVLLHDLARTSAILGDHESHSLLATAIAWQARLRCTRAGRPLYVLDPACAMALCKTDLPAETIGEVKFPHEAFYLSIPIGVATLEDPDSGTHDLEAILVAADRAADRANPSVETDVTSIVAFGKAKGTRPGALGIPEPNDTISWVTMAPTTNFEHLIGLEDSTAIMLRIVVNFASALSGGYLEVESVKPREPKSEGKRKVLERRGFGLHPYRVIHLGRKARQNSEGRDRETGTDARITAHWVRGYWQGYWKLDANGDPVYGSKIREDGKTLHRIRHWIAPRIQGAGEVPTSKVTYVRR